MNLRTRLGGLLIFGISAIALAGPLAPGESLGTNWYVLTFGAAKEGNDSLRGTGLENHGVFGSGLNLRLFDGEYGGSQQAGILQIHYKNNLGDGSGTEALTDLIPNRVPAVGSPLYGAGKFDGTALWLGHSRFKPGGTTAWNGTPFAAADGGADVRPDAAHVVELPLAAQRKIQRSFLLSQQVYVPDHGAEKSANPIAHGVCVQPYVERDGVGLTVPGGHGNRAITFPLDRWNLLEIRADFQIDGGATPSDATASVTYSYFVNGEKVGASDTFVLDRAGMTNHTGPIRFGPGYGLARGWQGSAPEAFIDDITVQEILPPK